MKKGKFITIDGVEGAGKSTQIKFIFDYLSYKKIDVILTREPGGTDLGEEIRQLLLSNKIKKMDANTELLLMFAARNEHVKTKIIPNLEKGKWVLSDRFVDASYAYQGGGRGLDLKHIQELEKLILNEFTPDMTFLLDVPVELGMDRIKLRGKKDRIELEDIDFFNKVRDVYIARARQFESRIKLIDSSKTPQDTKEQIRLILDVLL